MSEPVASRKVFSVTEVSGLVSGMLKEFFGDVWVEGEVSGFRAYPSGHLYFTLKDEQSQLSAVCFRSAAQKLKFRPEDGLQVVAHGRLDLYAASGKFQLVCDTMEPKGLGALQKAFEQLKQRLAAEGLFAEERKRPLPALVRTLGVVTSEAGAAIHDMLRTLRLHRAKLRVVLFPAQVQGEGAAESIAEGIRVLNERGDVDGIIVGRGGGSLEDLWAFNEEAVARAIAGSRAPVVSGVGHEVDFTIADFVADVRAATPTAAAQLIAAPWEELEVRLAEAHRSMTEGVERTLAEREQQLQRLVERIAALAQAWLLRTTRTLQGLNLRLARSEPGVRLQQQRLRTTQLAMRLVRLVEQDMNRHRNRLAQVAGKLDALSPLASLGRGYAICRKPDGTVVSRVAQVRVGEQVKVKVADGRLDCRVEQVAGDGQHGGDT